MCMCAGVGSSFRFTRVFMPVIQSLYGNGGGEGGGGLKICENVFTLNWLFRPYRGQPSNAAIQEANV